MKKFGLFLIIVCVMFSFDALAFQTCSSINVGESGVPCSYLGDDYDGVITGTELGVRRTTFYKSASTTIDHSVNHQDHRWDLVTSTNAAYFNGNYFQGKYTGNVVSMVDSASNFGWYGAGAPHVFLNLTAIPLGSGGITGTGIDCDFDDYCGFCEYDFTLGTKRALTAIPNCGYVFYRWTWGNGNTYSYSNPPPTLNICSDTYVAAEFKKEIILQSVLKEQFFPASRARLYYLTLSEATSIALISGGTLNVKGKILNSSGSIVASGSGYTDIGPVTPTSGNVQTNFMLRCQNLAAGTYTLEVTPETTLTPVDGEFSIVFLKRPNNSDEFFVGMDALLDDDDTSNDYLDIYVKALYPEFYATVNTIDISYNYGNSIPYGGVRRERQCKALVNFYAHEIMGEAYLWTSYAEENGVPYGILPYWLSFNDANSDCVADNDYIMQEGDGVLIYHSNDSFGSSCGSGDYFYEPGAAAPVRGSGNLSDYVIQGDVFADNYWEHFGLIYDGTNVLDANWGLNGKIHKALITSRGSDNWKVTRPQ